VRVELGEVLVTELERHFNEQLLSELRDRVEAIVARQLSEQVEAIVARELPERVEAIVARELPERLEAIIDRVPAKESSKANKILVDRFTDVFQQNLFGDGETVSGPGSRKDSPSVAQAISALKIVKETINFKSMNDVPCGDFNWMSTFLKCAPDVDYRGFDIVSMLIERNQALYSSYTFITLDITSATPPRADLIFSKDFFNHLSYADIKKALINMKQSKSEYLLATNNFASFEFVNSELPKNIRTSSRLLDLCLKPFYLPCPIWQADNYLGLWRLSDIEFSFGKIDG